MFSFPGSTSTSDPSSNFLDTQPMGGLLLSELYWCLERFDRDE